MCIATKSFTVIPANIDALFIPGGQCARNLIQHTDFINQLKLLAQKHL
ncbi:hypothetical protein SALWKB12_1286 [Snodgrassella communis]|uniref:Uncharacterized protein n=1 Tax=Snodgrassella communis TaxID=2946699 RepID=A0A836MPN2_9NEIS|nr:hypothetical protein SALWKB12_1286 [Snodgrassella communis]KDN14145.1 hypothetical protein SALWKB29_1806 [Snodgrassella communis]